MGAAHCTARPTEPMRWRAPASCRYGDSSSLMGFCEDRCPTTPQMWQLGWGQVVQLDSKSLRPGVTVQVQLVSQSDPSSRLLVWA